MYCKRPGRADSSKGFCKYLYLENLCARSLEKGTEKGRQETYRLTSLLITSMYFFMSSTSTGSFELKMVKGDMGAPSSTKLPPGWRRPPTRMISKRASAYLRNSRVDPACTNLVAKESKSPGCTVSRCL